VWLNMPIELTWLDNTSLLMVFAGLVTYEELVEKYQSVLAAHPVYVVLDGSNMMYETATLFDAYVLGLVRELLERDTFRMVVAVLSEYNALRPPVQHSYTEMGFAHKLCFATSIDEAKQVIEKLKNS